MEDIKAAIRDIPNFPKEGVLFKDITPILQDHNLFNRVIDTLTERYNTMHIDKIAGIESRGFIFGTPLVKTLDAGFVPLRKVGKLPYRTLAENFDLEYGSETLEIHEDAIKPGERVLIIDDLLATGGTAAAAVNLVRKCGGVVVEAAFVVELLFLHGRSRLEGVPLYTMVQFD